jgi:hypothetical protein
MSSRAFNPWTKVRIAQPALSNHVMALERELDARSSSARPGGPS